MWNCSARFQRPAGSGRLLSLFAVGLLVATAAARTSADETAAATASREALLGEMRRRAETTTVVTRGDEASPRGRVSSEPLFRYNDELREILDATLWAYSSADGGRPLALQKIEHYQVRNQRRAWLRCLTSLSPELVAARWAEGESWTSSEPGVQWQPLPAAPRPADGQVARLFQMKEISRRFAITLVDDPIERRTELRLLARPLYRYQDVERGLDDGAIFGFAAYGTNPDAVLLLEVHRQADGSRGWKFGLARMTMGQLQVRVDDEQVWQVPYVAPGGASKFPTWMFFFESPDAPQGDSPPPPAGGL